jgi:hypothetical protein
MAGATKEECQSLRRLIETLDALLNAEPDEVLDLAEQVVVFYSDCQGLLDDACCETEQYYRDIVKDRTQQLRLSRG